MLLELAVPEIICQSSMLINPNLKICLVLTMGHLRLMSRWTLKVTQEIYGGGYTIT